MQKQWKNSELHDSIMNLVASHARQKFNAPIYKVDEHFDYLRRQLRLQTEPKAILEAENSSPIYTELIERFFGAKPTGNPDIQFINKIGDIIVAQNQWNIIEVKTSENSSHLFNVNSESFYQFTKIPSNLWSYVHFLFFSSVDMSIKMVRMDQFHKIKEKVVLYHYNGVDAKYFTPHVYSAPFNVTTDNKGIHNPDIHPNSEFNTYFQFDLNAFPSDIVFDMDTYFNISNKQSTDEDTFNNSIKLGA